MLTLGAFWDRSAHNPAFAVNEDMTPLDSIPAGVGARAVRVNRDPMFTGGAFDEVASHESEDAHRLTPSVG